MIVDSSVVLAVLNREPDAVRYEETILTAVPCRMSVEDVLETSIVVRSRGEAGAGHELDAFLEHAEIEPAPVTAEHPEAARQAWRRFGKGRHPAALNFGDCFAYDLAQVAGEPLLCKGDDFARTDIPMAVPPAHGIAEAPKGALPRSMRTLASFTKSPKIGFRDGRAKIGCWGYASVRGSPSFPTGAGSCYA